MQSQNVGYSNMKSMCMCRCGVGDDDTFANNQTQDLRYLNDPHGTLKVCHNAIQMKLMATQVNIDPTGTYLSMCEKRNMVSTLSFEFE